MAGAQAPAALAQALSDAGAGSDDRTYWLGKLERITLPVLESLSRRRLRSAMPVEASDPAGRAPYTHLEAFGRVLSGIAPWLSAIGLGPEEFLRQQRFIALAQASLDAATDPVSRIS